MDGKLRIKLDPDLGDGQHWTVTDLPTVAAEQVRVWCENALEWGEEGDLIKIEIVRMTDDEVRALPEI